eukprot:PLAT16139.1.p1 GENE.PLAT16139.1~~PLAT16139.1.p1  ORF type:complete len:398 (+),score=168.53 PLAT16139.1:38-1231(+)
MADSTGWRPSMQTFKMVNIPWTKQTRGLIIVNQLVILGLIVYAVVYQFWLSHGYQRVETLVGTAGIRVAGVTKAVDEHTQERLVLDARDLLYPPREKGAAFVTTHLSTVKKQKRGLCREAYACNCPTEQADCATCSVRTDNGIMTGKCSQTRCQVQAWCPVEAVAAEERMPNYHSYSLDAGHLNMTLRVDARFPSQDLSIVARKSMTLRELVEAAHLNFTRVAPIGAVIYVQAYFDCDFDRGVDACVPEFRFHRISAGGEDSQNGQGRGFNFRYPRYITARNDDGVLEDMRDLNNVAGIRIILDVAGSGRAFDWAISLLNLGSALGMAAIAGLVVDIIMNQVSVVRFENRRTAAGKHVTVARRVKLADTVAEDIEDLAGVDERSGLLAGHDDEETAT